MEIFHIPGDDGDGGEVPEPIREMIKERLEQKRDFNEIAHTESMNTERDFFNSLSLDQIKHLMRIVATIASASHPESVLLAADYRGKLDMLLGMKFGVCGGCFNKHAAPANVPTWLEN